MRPSLLFSPEVQQFISKYHILGFIPLDKTLHFLIGALITIIMRWGRVKMRFIFLVLLILGIAKEINDYGVLNHSWGEQFLDVGVSFIYPLVLLGIIKIKSLLASRN